MTPPRKPGALTLATLSRLGGRVLCGLALVWIVALVGWPERLAWWADFPCRSDHDSDGRCDGGRACVSRIAERVKRHAPVQPFDTEFHWVSTWRSASSARRWECDDDGNMVAVNYPETRHRLFRRDSSPAVILGKLGR